MKYHMHALATIGLLSIALHLCLAQRAFAQDVVVISGATVIDGSGRAPIRNARVLIEGGRIRQVAAAGQVAIPPNALLVDAAGKYLIPGLADMHLHPGDGHSFQIQALAERPNFRRDLSRLLGWGVTTVFSTSGPSVGGFRELRSVANRDDSPVPRLFGVGLSLTTRGGHASRLGTFTPDTPDEARAIVRSLKAAGVDAIKLIYDDMASLRGAPIPMMTTPVMEAIIDESHRQNLKAYVHAIGLRHAKAALRAGADGLVHAVSEPIDDEFITVMKKNRAVYVTTHSLFHAFADIAAWTSRLEGLDERRSIPQEVFDRFRSVEGIDAYYRVMPRVPSDRLAVIASNLRRVHAAGILVVAGTDTSVPGVLLGASSQAELLLLVEAGLTPVEALRTATVNAAKMLGREQEQGTIEPGHLADLLILAGDPLADPRKLGRIDRVIKGGVVYDPTELLRAVR